MNFITIHEEHDLCYDVTATQNNDQIFCWEFKTLKQAEDFVQEFISLMEKVGEQWWMRQSGPPLDKVHTQNDTHDNPAKGH